MECCSSMLKHKIGQSEKGYSGNSETVKILKVDDIIAHPENFSGTIQIGIA